MIVAFMVPVFTIPQRFATDNIPACFYTVDCKIECNKRQKKTYDSYHDLSTVVNAQEV